MWQRGRYFEMCAIAFLNRVNLLVASRWISGHWRLNRVNRSYYIYKYIKERSNLWRWIQFKLERTTLHRMHFFHPHSGVRVQPSCECITFKSHTFFRISNMENNLSHLLSALIWKSFVARAELILPTCFKHSIVSFTSYLFHSVVLTCSFKFSFSFNTKSILYAKLQQLAVCMARSILKCDFSLNVRCRNRSLQVRMCLLAERKKVTSGFSTFSSWGRAG